MLFRSDWVGDYPDAENFLAPLLGCEKAEGNRCSKGNSALSGAFWSAPGLDAELQRSSRISGPERERLLRAIQQRTAAAVPYLPVWLMAEKAWSGKRITTPHFDGSGRLRLDQLRRLPLGSSPGPSASAAAPASSHPARWRDESAQAAPSAPGKATIDAPLAAWSRGPEARR